MKTVFALTLIAGRLMACGGTSAPKPPPGPTTPEAITQAPASPPTPAPETPTAALPGATTPAAPAPISAGSGSATPDADPQMTTSVTAVSNDVTTPNVVTPDKVIAGLRPKFNACYTDGLKKDPKLEGSVTLSAKIEKDGKVSAVTPKMVTGLNAAVLKCLSDRLKAASFAAQGGMSYTTSLDIPVGFTSH
jgi:hypothetical protein